MFRMSFAQILRSVNSTVVCYGSRSTSPESDAQPVPPFFYVGERFDDCSLAYVSDGTFSADAGSKPRWSQRSLPLRQCSTVVCLTADSP